MKKFTIKNLFAGLCFALLAPVAANADVEINETNFPDEYFREYLLTRDYGEDGVITDEEIAQITDLRLNTLAATRYAHNITNLEGIKFFTALTTLDCGRCPLTSLDVSGMTALTTLECRGGNSSSASFDHCELTELDVTGCTSLTTLNCSNSRDMGNRLTTLDVSTCTSLTELNCSWIFLETLELPHGASLTKLDCSYNNLTTLDVSGCTALTELDCNKNQLTELNVSGCIRLTKLTYYTDQSSALKVIGGTTLQSLTLNPGQITSLDVSDCPALTSLSCGDNQLTALDVTQNTALTSLSCGSNQLTALDVSKNTALTDLRCFNNQLTTLDVSGCTALTWLSCHDNQLTTLDVYDCSVLEDLDCSNNQIKGANMDNFIGSLPNKNGIIYIYDSTLETEGNVCTKSQVAAIKAKGWEAYYATNYNDKSYYANWAEYEGSDDLDGIIATEVGNGSEIGANAVAYDLNGNRVEGWQNRKGVYIVNGKKVMVK